MSDRGFLESKLRELQQQYRQLYEEFQSCRQLNHPALCRILQQLQQECSQQDHQLRRCAETGRSPAVEALSQAQLSYSLRAREILEQEMPAYLHSENSTSQEDQAESAALYAEYALDFATQAARHALLAALTAMDAQMTCAERKETTI